MQEFLMHNANMRTTFTPAPDIADRIYDMAKKSKKSLNQVVNELIRKGLSEDKSTVKESVRKYRVEPLNLQFNPGIDHERLSKVAEEMEDEERMRQHDHP